MKTIFPLLFFNLYYFIGFTQNITIPKPPESCTYIIKSDEFTSRIGGDKTIEYTFNSNFNGALLVKVEKISGEAEADVVLHWDPAYGSGLMNFAASDPHETFFTKRLAPFYPNQTIKLSVTNHSTLKNFKGKITFYAETNSIFGGPETGEVFPQTTSTKRSQHSCKNLVRVVFKRLSGDAKATIRIFGTDFDPRLASPTTGVQDVVWNAYETTKEIYLETMTNRYIHAEVKNISVGKRLHYQINAFAIDQTENLRRKN